MTKARVNADNVAGDISGVTAGTGLSGGGTSGTVTISADTAVVATTNNTLTMSGKTLTSPTISTIANTGTLTLPTSTDTLVGRATTDTLTNKTLSGATLTGTLTAGGGTGTNGQVLQSTGSGVQWGSAGLTWTQRRSPSALMIRSIAYNGSNLWVAAGAGGLLTTSPDGITWTDRTSGFGSNDINKVHFANGLWVAVGSNGTITTSTDGITWTARTANMGTNQIYDVIYANSLWVAVGNGGGTTNTGGITYSSDGITWTRKSQSISGIGSQYYGVIWNGTNWIIGANIGTLNFLYASTPSGTWTAANTNSGGDNYQIFYDGTRTLFIDNFGECRFSTNAIPSSATVLYGTAIRSGDTIFSFYYNGKIYNSGIIFYSFSTTPSSNNAIVGISSTLHPATGNQSSGAISGRAGAGWAGAAGFIATDNIGSIFTSF